MWKRMLYTFIVLWFVLITSCAKREYNNPPKTIYFSHEAATAARVDEMSKNTKLLWYEISHTGSMKPFLEGGMWVLVDPTIPYEDLIVDNVILYNAKWTPEGDPPVVHRIASIDKYGFIMSGDNNKHYERGEWRVTNQEYIGKVVGVIGYVDEAPTDNIN